MIKTIIFDFDGVILDSLPIRDKGFREIFAEYDATLVEEFMRFHRQNGGISRFVKIRYFFEELLQEPLSKERMDEMLVRFGEVMRRELVKSEYLIDETVAFIKANQQRFNMHIASGAEENELRYLCKAQGIDHLFKTIEGSPAPKPEIVKSMLHTHAYQPAHTVLIGDSINDFDAADGNQVGFYGYNNKELGSLGLGYINSFREFAL